MDTLSLVDSDHGESFEHFVSLLGITPRISGTFSPSPSSDLAAEWGKWRETLFLPHLAPSVIEAFHCGIRSRTQELEDIDSKLDRILPEPIRKQSIKAASPFFEGKTEMQGNREWLRYQERVEGGDSPGHLSVAFALQCALYHVALIPTLSSYAWFEFRSREGNGIPPAPSKEEITIFASILPDVAVAMESEKGDPEGKGHSLRAL